MAEPTEATLPFGMGSVDLTSPMAVVTMVISLIAGFTLFNMTGSIGQFVAQRINQFIANVTGTQVSGSAGDNAPDVI